MTRSRIREGATDWKGFFEILQVMRNWNAAGGAVSNMGQQSVHVNDEADVTKYQKMVDYVLLDREPKQHHKRE